MTFIENEQAQYIEVYNFICSHVRKYFWKYTYNDWQMRRRFNRILNHLKRRYWR